MLSSVLRSKKAIQMNIAIMRAFVRLRELLIEHKEQKIRDLTLKLIQVIVWFEILWAVVFLISMVFQWSGITEQLASAFFGAGFCGILLLAALTLLNVTANMNIISKVQVMKFAGGESAPEDRRATLKILAVSGALIAVIV
ncbi:MAG: hypothetical protein WC404_06505, partial [Candidatus Omnitrophota bacterium]